jgi:hypothetical protein
MGPDGSYGWVVLVAQLQGRSSDMLHRHGFWHPRRSQFLFVICPSLASFKHGMGKSPIYI